MFIAIMYIMVVKKKKLFFGSRIITVCFSVSENTLPNIKFEMQKKIFCLIKFFLKIVKKHVFCIELNAHFFAKIVIGRTWNFISLKRRKMFLFCWHVENIFLWSLKSSKTQKKSKFQYPTIPKARKKFFPQIQNDEMFCCFKLRKFQGRHI